MHKEAKDRKESLASLLLGLTDMPREVATATNQYALVISGNTSIGPEFQSLLQQWGYFAELATTPSEALSALETNRVTFSVLDMELEGADDPAFVQRLRNESGTPKPVIAIFQQSARNDTDGTALGVTDVLFRPFAPDDLEKAVKRALDATGDWKERLGDDSSARLGEEVRSGVVAGCAACSTSSSSRRA